MASTNSVKIADLEPVGPGTLAGNYLRRFWHPVARLRDLKPGRAKPVEILGEKFTIFLSENGTPHLVGFSCPHRGTQLSVGWVEGDEIRCRYHGWKFNANGQCLEQPNEDRPFVDKISIPAYPVQEYLGLVFAFLGKEDPPPFRVHPDFDRPGVIVTDPVEIVPCTFWNRLDNETAHIPWVHRATALRKGRHDLLRLRREEITETDYGFRVAAAAEGDPVNYRNTAHVIMPNIYQFYIRTRAKGFEDQNLGDTKITWTVPVNDACFAAFDVTHTPLLGKDGERYMAARLAQQEAEAETREDLAIAILAGELAVEDLPGDMGAYTSFEIEDYVTQVGQGPLAGRTNENLGCLDAKLAILRRLWFHDVAAVRDGQATVDWQLPNEPLVPENALPLDADDISSTLHPGCA